MLLPKNRVTLQKSENLLQKKEAERNSFGLVVKPYPRMAKIINLSHKKAEPISALLLLCSRLIHSPNTLNFLAHLRLTILHKLNFGDFMHVGVLNSTATDTTETITSSTAYSADGNFLQSVTDSLGHVTTYNYDETTKLLKFIEDANSHRTGYKYDKRNRTTNVYLDADEDGNLDTNEPAVEYLYAQNRYSNIKTASTTYTLTYDTFGNLKTIKAGNKTLATYSYAANNGKLTSLTYGNGDYETYTYDHLDRLTKVVYNGVANSGYELQYDANGRLFQTIDHQAGITHTYEYDSLDRLIRAWQKDTSTGTTILGVENAYDSYGRASGSTYVIGNTTQNYNITYEDITGLLHTYTTPHNSFEYSYDSFDRLTTKAGNAYSITRTYTNRTQRVRLYTISQTDDSTVTYTYLYNALGNIRMIYKNGTYVRGYSYDALNRLTHESHMQSDIAYEYSYDNAGNILTKTTKVGSTVQSTVNYGYSTSEWGDLLTNYNGTTITYDANGNPLNWKNILYMGWEGRNLVSLTEDMLYHGVFFEYNADGIRTKKTLTDYDGTTTTHDYILDGTTILKETITSGNATTTLYYYYDESGISGISYNGTKYSFVRNLQGDVIAILNSNGATMVEYDYDAWGNILSTTGSLASTLGAINPFRYRGYYYDTETGFYYLNSRYYDPQVGRFINADGIIGANGDIMGYNMFAYCSNNPVMCVDPTGCYSEDWYIYTCANISVQVDEYDPRNFDKAAFIRVIEDLLERYGPNVIRHSYLAYYCGLIEDGYCSGYGTLSFTAGINAFFFTGGVALTLDREGNFAIQPYIGVSSSSSVEASLGLSQGIAKNYESLNGWTASSQAAYALTDKLSANIGCSYGSSFAATSYSLSWSFYSDPVEMFLPYGGLSKYLGENESYSLTYTWSWVP